MLSASLLVALQEVHSFDLVATAPGVVACNMAAVPLEDASIDAAIFCLALMGTDYGSFLQVLHRLQFIPAHAAYHGDRRRWSYELLIYYHRA